jgi:hypothetical protein
VSGFVSIAASAELWPGGNRLAPTYAEAQLTRPFPFNALYCIDDVHHVDGGDLRVRGSGLAQDKKVWSVMILMRCRKPNRVGADKPAKYVGFRCADDYYESIDMPTALHPHTLLTVNYDYSIAKR